ncbi:hypothetical protein BpHYR1_004145 [Brachionus plicatilis]|uniref:Uncharacterized protein n=1 Tax=Brachionus plicatilis TaxID=10195 RepID=A0A3M7R1N1_BRAPC|nr:hypothetical protein BpHYR1_004145 [Brachionus plicatilis]
MGGKKIWGKLGDYF